MGQQRFSFLAAVYLILEKGGKILFVRRFKTGWRDGMYTLPAGHVDGNEEIASAMIREAREEIGVLIKLDDIQVVHVMHQVGDKEYFDFYLVAKEWKGTPTNKEPDKCDDLKWFPIKDLPKNVLPNVKSALEHYKNGQTFSEFKWD